MSPDALFDDSIPVLTEVLEVEAEPEVAPASASGAARPQPATEPPVAGPPVAGPPVAGPPVARPPAPELAATALPEARLPELPDLDLPVLDLPVLDLSDLPVLDLPVLDLPVPASVQGAQDELNDDLPAPLPAAAPVQAAPEEEAPLPGWDVEQWRELEQQLTTRILKQLLSRADLILEQHIQDSMGELLATALHSLTGQLRAGLHESMEQLVARAVSDELHALQAAGR